jgi:hypothetical protein
MKWWALRLSLFVIVFPALVFWGLVFGGWLGYFLVPAALVVFVVIERRFERWLRLHLDDQTT